AAFVLRAPCRDILTRVPIVKTRSGAFFNRNLLSNLYTVSIIFSRCALICALAITFVLNPETMNIRTYIRKEQLNADGTASIWFEVSRARIRSGETCKPEAWDKDRQAIKI